MARFPKGGVQPSGGRGKTAAPPSGEWAHRDFAKRQTTMGASGYGIEIEGMREFRKGLKTLEGGAEIQKEIKSAAAKVVKTVQGSAQGKARALGGNAAKAAPFIQTRNTVTGSALVLNDFAASKGVKSTTGKAYVFGAEFGARSLKQFRRHRGGGKGAGYFLWPAVRTEMPFLRKEFEDSIHRAARKAAFPDG